MSGDDVLLELREVRREFDATDGPVVAVDAADLSVSRGEVVVVGGASGSGKTTLLLMAAAMLRPTRGVVRVLGQTVYELSSRERSQMRQDQIATILPLFHLLPYLDAAGNVAVASRRPGKREQAMELLQQLGLANRAHHRPEQLSSGERRRVMVARALLNRAPLLLADEPTANLDEASAGVVRQAIENHVSQGGGALVVTHEDAAEYRATQTLMMSQGRLTREGRVSGALLAVLASVLVMIGLVWMLSGSGTSRSSGDAPIRLICAAGIKPAVDVVVQRYEQETGRRVTVSYGGSGTLLGQLKIDPDSADLYLAADDSYVDTAREEGLAAEYVPLATMKPVIAVAKGNPRGITGLKDLLRDDLRVGLANPDAAAVGKISRKILSDLGVWEQVSTRAKVFKPTVNDVANDLELGTIDAAILWDATVNQYEKLDMVTADAMDAQQRLVTITVVDSTARSADALHFARYLAAPDRGGEAFRELGYGAVAGDAWEDRPSLLLYAGSMFNQAVEETILEFEQREGVTVDRIYNGCGILVSQMQAGGQPDAYLSCDNTFLEQVSQRFGPPVGLSENPMVIITQPDNPHHIEQLDDLTRAGLRVGLSHPTKSALGHLTERLLKEEGVLEELKASGNWKQDAPQGDFLSNALRTGALDAAIVYRSNAQPWADQLHIIPIDSPNATAQQPAAVAVDSRHSRLADRLLESLQTQESIRRFETLGFTWMAQRAQE